MNAVTYFYVTPTPVRGMCSLGPTDLHTEALFLFIYLL